jgi:hypothetical protein
MNGGVERRLVLRLMAYWRVAADGGALPTFDALARLSLDEIRPHLFLLRLRRDEEPVVERIGPTLAERLPFPVAGLPVSAVPADTMLGRGVAYYRQVLDRGIPISQGGSFTDSQGISFLFRSVIAPLDDGQGAIGYLVGAANGKIAEGDG